MQASRWVGAGAGCLHVSGEVIHGPATKPLEKTEQVGNPEALLNDGGLGKATFARWAARKRTRAAPRKLNFRDE
jgi:hypothetical protein